MDDLFERRRMARYLAEYRRSRYCSADGYVRKVGPNTTISPAAVTLAGTNKTLWTVANIPAMGKDYWTFVGKEIEINVKGRITTAATPGNLTLAWFYGTGADANGVSLVASAAQTLLANQTSITWEAWVTIRCDALGATGGFFADGRCFFGATVIAAMDFHLPASTPVASGACDLTVANNIITLQALRTGSTVETMQVHRITVLEKN